MPTEAQLGYLAGLIDGEGSISLFLRRGKRRTPSTSIIGMLEISMTHPGVLHAMHGVFPEGRVYEHPRPSARHRTPWSWMMSTQQAARVLVMVLPYLLIKRRQAEVLLELAGMPRRGRVKFNPDRQMALYDEIKQLNRRGPISERVA